MNAPPDLHAHEIVVAGRVPESFLAKVEAATTERQSGDGLAGGASGGDLLFHELCAELGIPSLLRFTVPSKIYVPLSVAPARRVWEQRFAALLARLMSNQVHTLAPCVGLPSWTGEPHRAAAYDPWQRTNAWLLEDAMMLAPVRSALGLWDGKPSDSSGGTEHLLRLAQASPGFDVQAIPIPD